MKTNKLIVCSIFAVIFALTFAACSSGGGGGTPKPANPFVGTWDYPYTYYAADRETVLLQVNYTLVIKNDGTWKLTSEVKVDVEDEEEAIENGGTYERDGNNATFTSTIDPSVEEFTASFAGNELIFNYPEPVGTLKFTKN